MSDEGSLPVIVEVAVRDGDTSASVGDIKKSFTWLISQIQSFSQSILTVIEVLIVIQVGAEVNVINPDLLGCLDADVISRGQTFGDLEVADDDIARVEDTETDTSEGLHIPSVGQVRNGLLG